MEYRKLGNSGLKVSEIGLGTNTFRKRIDEPTSIAIVNRAIEMGITYIDTADTYDQGGSEEFVGKALQAGFIRIGKGGCGAGEQGQDDPAQQNHKMTSPYDRHALLQKNPNSSK